jgi:hypothetical protein
VELLFGERCKEVLAETKEVIENLAAEVNAELINNKLTESEFGATEINSIDGKSEVAKDLRLM